MILFVSTFLVFSSHTVESEMLNLHPGPTLLCKKCHFVQDLVKIFGVFAVAGADKYDTVLLWQVHYLYVERMGKATHSCTH